MIDAGAPAKVHAEELAKVHAGELAKVHAGTRAELDTGARRYYRPELDVLRFVAFLLVYLSHVVPGDEAFFTQLHIPRQIADFIIAFAAGGSWGVDLFFALSSYLITTILLRERQTLGRIDIGSFYWRRVLRIWPLYFVFLLCVVPLIRLWLPADEMSGKYALTYALFVGNWACVFWGYPHSIAGPLWSVSIEEQFYLTWPLILRRWANHLVAVACVLLGVAFLTRGWLAVHGAIHPQIWCNTLARLDPIACGALLAAYTQRHQFVLSARVRTLLIVSGLLGIAAIGQFGDFTGSRAMITFPAGTLACMALLVATVGTPSSAKNVILAYLGRISYGLYVFHLMFIEVFGVLDAHDPLSRSLRIAAAFTATVAVSACFYRFLEQPFLRLKRSKFTHIATV